MAINDFIVERTLGEGGFGTVVLLAHSKKADCKLAMKKLRVQNEEENEEIQSEYRIHKKLSDIGHKNIIKMIEKISDNFSHSLYMEYADGGELFDEIESGVGMEISKARLYYLQLVGGIEFMHNNSIVHRDIKPENILLTKSGILKISDFGMASIWRVDDQEVKLIEPCGTQQYAAPEIYSKLAYSGPPVDIWSSGIVLADGYYTKWINESVFEDHAKLLEVGAYGILQQILSIDVKNRATIESIEGNPWLKQGSKANTSRGVKRRQGEQQVVINEAQRSNSCSGIEEKRACLRPSVKSRWSTPILPVLDVSTSSTIN